MVCITYVVRQSGVTLLKYGDTQDRQHPGPPLSRIDSDGSRWIDSDCSVVILTEDLMAGQSCTAALQNDNYDINWSAVC